MQFLPMLQVALSLGGNEIDQVVGGELLLGVFKFFFITGALLYAIFAFIVIRQVYIMRRTLITDFSPLFTVLAYLHFFVALFVIVLFFLIL